MMMMMMISV